MDKTKSERWVEQGRSWPMKHLSQLIALICVGLSLSLFCTIFQVNEFGMPSSRVLRVYVSWRFWNLAGARRNNQIQSLNGVKLSHYHLSIHKQQSWIAVTTWRICYTLTGKPKFWNVLIWPPRPAVTNTRPQADWSIAWSPSSARQTVWLWLSFAGVMTSSGQDTDVQPPLWFDLLLEMLVFWYLASGMSCAPVRTTWSFLDPWSSSCFLGSIKEVIVELVKGQVTATVTLLQLKCSWVFVTETVPFFLLGSKSWLFLHKYTWESSLAEITYRPFPAKQADIWLLVFRNPEIWQCIRTM